MQWTDQAVIIAVRKFGEKDAIAHLFTKQYGFYNGIVKNINNKQLSSVCQVGNMVNATWKARLPEHMGLLQLELAEAYTSYVMHEEIKLVALSGLCNILYFCLPERMPENKLFAAFSHWLTQIKYGEEWFRDYVFFEVMLLAELGFGLDLTACAVTGDTTQLSYVSPKSGRAVSEHIGLGYHDKLFVLPRFMHDPHGKIEVSDLINGLKITGYFIEKYLLLPKKTILPIMRTRLVKLLQESELAAL